MPRGDMAVDNMPHFLNLSHFAQPAQLETQHYVGAVGPGGEYKASVYRE
jgi:hypothetical protein